MRKDGYIERENIELKELGHQKVNIDTYSPFSLRCGNIEKA